MNALAQRIETVSPYSFAIESDEIADLARIYDPDVNLCLIRRDPDPEIRSFVNQFLCRDIQLELAEEIEFEHFNFSTLLAEHREIPGHSQWWRDVARLVCTYCDLSGSERVGLRLRVLEKPMCPRFHVDSVICRMVCTYGGPGTEWLPDDSVNRSKLGRGANGLPDHESGLILDESAIRAMPPYAIGLMKGERWQGNEGRGAVHRSPKLSEGQPRRLLLTMDAM